MSQTARNSSWHVYAYTVPEQNECLDSLASWLNTLYMSGSIFHLVHVEDEIQLADVLEALV